MRRIPWGLIGALLVIGALAPPASAYVRPGRLEQLSPAADANGDPVVASAGGISDDGRWALLYTANALVPEDRNNQLELYLLDRDTGSVERVCRSVAGGDPNGYCSQGSLSADGRVVAFQSNATNLVATDVNGSVLDVYVWDRDTEKVRLASVSGTGAQNDDSAMDPEISADGRFVAFASFSEVLSPDDKLPWQDIFVRDLSAGTTDLVTVSSDEVQGTTNAMFPTISGDGRYVAFATTHPLEPRDTNGVFDVYVRDRLLGTTEVVSLATNGTAGTLQATYPSISRDGRIVAFGSGAGNLVPTDNMGGFDTFVRDRQTGTLERVVASKGTEGNGVLSSPQLSPDGRYVAVHTLSTNLGYEDQNGNTTDAYVHDRVERTTRLVSVNTEGKTGNAFSSIGGFVDLPDGDRAVLLFSYATDLLEGGSLPGTAYLAHLGPELGATEIAASTAGDSVQVSGAARLSGATVWRADDERGDAGGLAGADLTFASMRYRPEEEDVLVELGLAPVRPHAGVGLVGTTARQPGAITYGVSFDGCVRAGEDPAPVCGRHEVRASQDLDADGPSFGLYRCAAACTKVADLTGGIGTAGELVRVSLPADVLGGEGATLALRSAYAAAGDTGSGPLRTLDEAALGTGVIARTSVEVGIAPPGAHVEDVTFHPAAVDKGRFSGNVDRGNGPRTVWVRTCVGPECATRSLPLAA